MNARLTSSAHAPLCCLIYFFSLCQYPYRVLPNRTGSDGIIGGIIECVPNASSRDEIGKATACSLKDYYISRFGPEGSREFQRAQRNFIMSCAGQFCIALRALA